jgi:hypothetical protein
VSSRYLRFEKKFPVPIGVQTCEIGTRQGHDKKKSIGELGKKNQADAGRVSYTSPLQLNVSLFSQAICSWASNGIFILSEGVRHFV